MPRRTRNEEAINGALGLSLALHGAVLGLVFAAFVSAEPSFAPAGGMNVFFVEGDRLPSVLGSQGSVFSEIASSSSENLPQENSSPVAVENQFEPIASHEALNESEPANDPSPAALEPAEAQEQLSSASTRELVAFLSSTPPSRGSAVLSGESGLEEGARPVLNRNNGGSVPFSGPSQEPDESLHGVSSAEGDGYNSRLLARIESAKRYPRASRSRGEQGRVCISFVIAPDGNLVAASILTPCAHERLNTAALETIQRAAPFDPVPPSLSAPVSRQLWISFNLSAGR